MAKLVLITGAGGFIGVNLVAELLSQGFDIIGIDNFCAAGKNKSAQFQGNVHYDLIEADISSDIKSLINNSKLLKANGKIDQIFNLACPASPPRYLKLPLETINACTIGLKNVLDIARENHATVLQASTSEIYGDPLEHPQREIYRGNVNSIGPRSCYDEGKRIAETICYEYRKNFNLDIKLARIFNTYGPFMDPDDGRVVSNFIIQALHDKELTMYGDGKQTRSFQYISDLIAGLIKLINTDADFFGPVNLGNPNEFTMLELTDLILKLTNSSSKLIYRALPQDDPKQRKPDISLAKSKLNWAPVVELNEGLERTINYFRTL